LLFNFLKDKRNIVIVLLAVLLAVKIPEEGGRFAVWILTGTFFAAAVDFFINKVFLKRIIFPKSAVITGFILSGILDYEQSLPALLFISFIAIVAKHILILRGKHILNPANSGLFLASLLNLPLTWMIESNVYFIVVVGLYLAYSLKKLPHIAGFLGTFVLLFHFLERANPVGVISWFFVFIMLIEPKTSGPGGLRGGVFGATAGLASFLIFRFFPGAEFFIVSLVVANLFNPVFDKIFVRTNNAKGGYYGHK
jgi:Na+-transporting NADH:ubiquinone oxidoreductase subunit NqrB